MPTSSSAYRSVATASSTAKSRTKVQSSPSTQQNSKASTRKTNRKNDEPSTRPPLATADIVEKATLSLNGLSTRDALTVWKALGLYLNDQLVVRRRVVSIDRFGVFGYNDACEAVFLHSPVFLQSNRLKEGSLASQGLRGQPALAANAAPMSKINAAEIGNEYLQTCGREVVSNVVAHVVAFIGKMAKQGCALKLSVQPLGEWVCTTESKAEFRFLPEFQQLMIKTASVKPQSTGSEETKKPENKSPEEMRERGLRDSRKGGDQAREAESLLTPKALEDHTTREHYTRSIPASSQRSSQKPSQVSGSKSSAPTSNRRIAWSQSDQQPQESTERHQKSKTKVQTPSRPSTSTKSARPVGADGVVGRVRAKLLERCGEKGLNALQRVLSLLDTSGDGALSAQELKFGLRDLGIELTTSELQQVVAYFDRNGDGVVSLDELVGRLRGGDLSERRRQLIEKAFDCMDHRHRGVVTLDDMRDNYDVSLLPRVRAGKKTKAQALTEFLREWETSVEHNNGIPKEAFVDYYHNVSACILDDSDFELHMRQTWHVSPTDSEPESSDDQEEAEYDRSALPPRRQNDQKAASSTAAVHKESGDDIAKQWAYLSSVILPPRRGVHAPITLDDVCRRLGVNRVWGDGNETMNTRVFTKALTSLDRQLSAKDVEPFIQLITQHCSSTASSSDISLAALYKALLEPPQSLVTSKPATTTSTNGVIERIRHRLLQRLKAQDSEGSAPSFLGLHALQRTLRLLDLNGDKRLSKDELKLGLRKLGVEINFHELDQLFTCLDADRSGCVDMDEFLVAMRGDDALTSNKARLALVHQAFDLLDRDRDGFVTLEELSKAYDTSKHPEVLAGRMTSEDALRQFAQQWDTLDKDGIVTKHEFEAYYQNVSALVDRDDYFELMMRNAWHISGGSGQSANTSNRRVLVTHADGSQRVHEVQNDLGIRATDTNKIRDKLRSQGVNDAGQIGLTGYVETKKATNHSKRPTLQTGARYEEARRETPPTRRTQRSITDEDTGSVRGKPRAAAPSDFFASSGVAGGDTQEDGARHAKQRLRQREIRERAALVIQANFRGFKSRKFVEVVRRQQAAQAARRQRDEIEQGAARPRVVARAALKSFYGF